MPPGMLLAGEVGKPHGLSGEVYVVVISDDPRRFEPGSTLQHDDGRVLVVEGARAHGDRFLVKFEGIDTRESAMTLRGALYVPATEARDLDPDEFWTDDLVGCSVATSEGLDVGTITRVISGSAQDMFEVRTPRGPRLVPAVKAIVVEVDTTARKVVIDPPEGLLE